MFMFKKIAMLVCAVGVILLAACDKTDNSNCQDKICDESFATLVVKFVDKNGEGVAVDNYSAVNQRTGDTLSVATSDINSETGIYIVASDRHISKLSESGDSVKVTGTYTKSAQTKSAIIKVKGGNCACHISKIDGPEQIKFD